MDSKTGQFSIKKNKWLVPYCDAEYLITLEDSTKSLTHGKYYVTAVAVEFSSAGAKRTISLGSSLNKD